MSEYDLFTPIAIVGLSFDFPGVATSEESFWNMLYEGRSASTKFPPDRIKIDSFYDPENSRPSSIPVRGGNFLQEDIGAFDAPFFSITPTEASCMDPQHRRMLETTYHALENGMHYWRNMFSSMSNAATAGISMAKCSGSDTSVYTGCFTNDYLSITQQDYEAEQQHAAMGLAPSMLANRLSWFFNLKGASMNLDSACSSSLVALHLACQDLRNRKSSMAIVGGANLVYHPNFMKMMSNSNFLSKESQCWSFDEKANGYARGEGFAVLIIKRVDDALRDHDNIRAVIRNTGSNQDGRTPGITQPNQQAQIDLITQTFHEANLEMEPTRFFETHGTGTPIGDPVEANAVGIAFSEYRSPEEPLYIGAVKSNIGHLEGASGLAGIIKTVLVLERGIIPPIARLTNLNSRIDAEKLRLMEPTAWPEAPLRRACVNSFGFGGTNAVAILDDSSHYLAHISSMGYHVGSLSTSIQQQHKDRTVDPSAVHMPKLLVWSAGDQSTLERLSAVYDQIMRDDKVSLDALSWNLATRRSHLAWRSSALVDENGRHNGLVVSSPARSSESTGLIFAFTGQGSQYQDMGVSLARYPAYRSSLVASQRCLDELGCTWSFLDMIGSVDPRVTDSPEFSQPCTTILQIALVDLLDHLKIYPVAVLGHSSGEIAAAYAAGALSRFSAIKVSYHRGILSSQLVAQSTTELSMMAVKISRQDILPYFARLERQDGVVNVTIGCVNSPRSITITGTTSQLVTLQNWLQQDGIYVRNLRVRTAYHSTFMRSIVSDYITAIDGLDKGTKVTVPMTSSVTKEFIDKQRLCTANYWAQNLTSVVEFSDALYNLWTTPNKNYSHVIEVGPQGALRGPIQDVKAYYPQLPELSYLPCLQQRERNASTFLKAVGALHCSGHAVDLLATNGLEKGTWPIMPNLPPYPFNHSQSYWNESRLSRNFRFSEHPRHSLLGTRNLDWNRHIGQWRNILRQSDAIWLQDHRINGEVIFPAAAMIAMAIAASEQLSGNQPDDSEIDIKDVAFLRPITFQKSQNFVETQFVLSAAPDTGEKVNRWAQFRLFVLVDGGYKECCNGFIRSLISLKHGGEPKMPFRHEPSNWAEMIFESCKEDVQDLYQDPIVEGVRYGESFRNLLNIKVGDNGKASADLDCESWKTREDRVYPRYRMHPATMDGLAQILAPALRTQMSNLPAMLPTRVSRIWIAPVRSEFTSGRLKVAVECKPRGYRGATADVVACSTRRVPLVCFVGLETTFIGDPETKDPSERQLCMELSWNCDIRMMTSSQIRAYCIQNRPKEAEDAIRFHRSLATVIMCYIEDALTFVHGKPNLVLPSHISSYVAWMEFQQKRLRDGILPISFNTVNKTLSDPNARASLEREVADTGIEGLLFTRIGEQLIDVLAGDVDPLTLMFVDGLADRYYEHMLADGHHSHPASVFVDLLCFQNPNLRVLEVGAGTGGQSKQLLTAMCKDNVRRWKQYDYTDVSPAFFPSAREKLKKYADRITFRTFDVSKDPVRQSFEEEAYDLVVASHVLHATKSIEDSLRNIRKLLKPGGKLLLFETTLPAEALAVGFGFGVLKDWWRPLDYELRTMHSPYITTRGWHEKLKETAFSGVDIEIPGQETLERRYTSIIMSTAIEMNAARTAKPREAVAVVMDPNNTVQYDFSNSLSTKLLTRDVACNFYTLQQLTNKPLSSATMVVFLLEIDADVLYGISSPVYENLKTILLASNMVLWVTRSRSGGIEPRHHLVDGLGRTLMSEDATRKFSTLCLDHDTANESEIIAQVVTRTMEVSVKNLELNYRVKRGIIYTSRVVGCSQMNTVIAQAKLLRQPRMIMFGNAPVVSLQPTLSTHSTVQWMEADGNRTIPELESDEVLVQTEAIDLSLRDHYVAMGRVDESELSLGGAGIVISSGASANLQSGERVCFIHRGSARNRIHLKDNLVAAIPSAMQFEEAASIPTALLLAYYALVIVARLQPREKILLLQGHSCVGQLAIQIAVRLGASVIVQCSSVARADALRDRLGFQECEIIVEEDLCSPMFKRSIEWATIDVIVGSMAKIEETELVHRIAPATRCVDLSSTYTTNKQENSHVQTSLNAMRASINIAELLQQRPALISSVFQKALKFFLDGGLKSPQPLHIFSATEANAAFEHFRFEGIMGKRIITTDSKAKTLVNLKIRPASNFDPNATYIIAGGLGGLGRGIARWMASQGARNLILFSRSGPRSTAARALITELELQGVRILAPALDVSHLDDLRSFLNDAAVSIAPVKGCIQATIALRDNLFGKMTYDDWMISTRSKVNASWNLHELLPPNLDFFVLLSSVNGIFGGRAQANYAAGNTFKDALAHYRVSCGQKAVSIDLGMVVTDGVVAESEYLLDSMRRIGHLMDIRHEELIALLDYYCNANLPILTPAKVQVLVGIESSEHIRAKGVDIHHSMHRPIFRNLFNSTGDSGNSSLSTIKNIPVDRMGLLKGCSSLEEATRLISPWFSVKLAQTLGIKEHDVDETRSLHSYGIDSLVAIDLKNWMHHEIGAETDVLLLLSDISLVSLCEEAAKRSTYIVHKT